MEKKLTLKECEFKYNELLLKIEEIAFLEDREQLNYDNLKKIELFIKDLK